MRLPLFERHPRQELSGYLDNELASPRVEALEAHLASCPTCHAELAALRNLKSQLAALPESPAPRSFALTPQMAQRPATEPARVRPPARVAALTNGMRLAGAGMAAALAVVMVLNFSGSGSDTTGDSSTGALTANSTTYYLDSRNADTSGALAIPSLAATGSAENSFATAVPPDGGTTGSAPDVGPAAGESLSGAAPTAVPAAAADLPQKNADGSDNPVEATAGSARSLETDQAAPAAAPAVVQPDEGGGVDILVLLAIVLAAGAVLAFAGSVLIPRFAGDGD